nr:MORN motif-containing protein [Tanacetum cinerariifolium]
MGNVFCAEVRINRRFDLKGSSHGRIMDIPETEIDANITLKDLDIIFIFLMQKYWFKEFNRRLESEDRAQCHFFETRKDEKRKPEKRNQSRDIQQMLIWKNKYRAWLRPSIANNEA